MKRLSVLVEGETEEEFVRELLAPHLYQLGFAEVSAKLLGNARARSRRGGITKWSRAQRDILHRLKGDPGVYVTTFVDYYALPQGDKGGWPGRDAAGKLPFGAKALTVEDAVANAITKQMDGKMATGRFVPFVMMHEFEALLFSDCQRFAEGIYAPELQPAFQEVRDQFNSPEEINDHWKTAPSRRILTISPSYKKVLLGNLAALNIGLDRMKEQCAHFAGWIEKLESLEEIPGS